MVEVFGDILKQIPTYRQIGVHGLTVEGMKYKRKRPGLEKIGGDFCYPVSVLKQHFEVIGTLATVTGLRFMPLKTDCVKWAIPFVAAVSTDWMDSLRTRTI
ncbi:MAG: hypothetical protein ACLR8Y_15390 [Alistipes indistinctus]